MTINDVIHHAEGYFTQVVEQGSDQQLFIAGYLHGHFSLVLAQVNRQNLEAVQQFKALLLANLEQAFAQQELESADQAETLLLVEQLFSLTSPLQ